MDEAVAEDQGLVTVEEKRQKSSKLSVEHYLGCGFYQVYHLLLSQFVTVAHASNMTMMAFGKIVPQWTCDDENWTILNSTNFYANSTITTSNTVVSSCTNLAKYGCEKLTMTTDYKSVVYEWKLLCDDTKYVFFSITMQMVGVIAGSQIWGQLADWYGRKWILFLALIGQIISGIASVFSGNIHIFTILRFAIGFFVAGSITTNHVYFNEFVISKHRFWMGALNSWGFSQMFLAMVAYLTADWKMTTIVCNVAAIPALVMICFIKESPSWLIQRGRNDAARRSISHVTKMNMKDRVKKDEIHESLFNNDVKKKKYSLYHVFNRKSMALHTATLSFAFFSISVISFGIIFDTDSLAGNKFFNFFLFASLKFLASIATIFADTCSKSIGRRLLFWFPDAVITCCCLTIFIFKVLRMEKSITETVISIIAIMVTSPIWTSLALSATELYPTPIRNNAIGVVMVFSRIGGAVAPEVLYIAKFWAPSTYLVYFVLAAMSLIFHVMFIPETKGQSLPDAMPSRKKRPTTVVQPR